MSRVGMILIQLSPLLGSAVAVANRSHPQTTRFIYRFGSADDPADVGL